MGWNVRPEPSPHETWDGGVGKYRQLLAAVGEAVCLTESETRFHRNWIEAFEVAQRSFRMSQTTVINDDDSRATRP
jgi:hypothetical protein